MASPIAIIEGLGSVTVIEPDVLARRDELIAKRAALGLVCEANIVEADALVGEQALHDRNVEKRRVALKAPFLEAGRFIDEAAAEAKIGGHALVAEVAAVRREMERRKAEQDAERERIAAEAAAKLREAEREEAEAAAALEALEAEASPEDAPAIDALREEVQARSEVLRGEVMAAGGRAWVASATAGSRVLPRIKSNTRTVMRLEIYDEDKIPHQINGVRLLAPLKSPITSMLKSGIDVPGARLVEVDEATAGRR